MKVVTVFIMAMVVLLGTGLLAGRPALAQCNVPLSSVSVEADGWITGFQGIPVTAGTHTIAMASASTSPGWNDILYFQQNDGLAVGSVDYCFTLNGVGDARTVEFVADGEVHVGIFDTHIADNSGSITIAIDGVEHVIDVAAVSVHVDEHVLTEFGAIVIDEPGEYTIEMSASTAQFGWNDILFFQQNDGLAPGSVDYCFTLNGVGDSRTLEFAGPGELHVGIFDSYIQDNLGAIEILIDGVCIPVVPVEVKTWSGVKALYR